LGGGLFSFFGGFGLWGAPVALLVFGLGSGLFLVLVGFFTFVVEEVEMVAFGSLG